MYFKNVMLVGGLFSVILISGCTKSASSSSGAPPPAPPQSIDYVSESTSLKGELLMLPQCVWSQEQNLSCGTSDIPNTETQISELKKALAHLEVILKRSVRADQQDDYNRDLPEMKHIDDELRRVIETQTQALADLQKAQKGNEAFLAEIRQGRQEIIQNLRALGASVDEAGKVTLRPPPKTVEDLTLDNKQFLFINRLADTYRNEAGASGKDRDSAVPDDLRLAQSEATSMCSHGDALIIYDLAKKDLVQTLSALRISADDYFSSLVHDSDGLCSENAVRRVRDHLAEVAKVKSVLTSASDKIKGKAFDQIVLTSDLNSKSYDPATAYDHYPGTSRALVVVLPASYQLDQVNALFDSLDPAGNKMWVARQTTVDLINKSIGQMPLDVQGFPFHLKFVLAQGFWEAHSGDSLMALRKLLVEDVAGIVDRIQRKNAFFGKVANSTVHYSFASEIVLTVNLGAYSRSDSCNQNASALTFGLPLRDRIGSDLGITNCAEMVGETHRAP